MPPLYPAAMASFVRIFGSDIIEGKIPERSVSTTTGPDRYVRDATDDSRTTNYRLYVDDQDRVHLNVAELDDGTFYVEGWERASSDQAAGCSSFLIPVATTSVRLRAPAPLR